MMGEKCEVTFTNLFSFPFFGFCFYFGLHPVMLGVDSWLCYQGLLLAVHGGLYVVPSLES